MVTLKLFMWGYQTYFRVSAECAAKSIFDKLDEDLSPKVFLIGVLYGEKGNNPICLEPEDCGYELELFSDVKKRAECLAGIDEEGNVIYDSNFAQNEHDEWIKSKSLAKAIEEVIRSRDERNGIISFCSMPVVVSEYKVLVVLQIKKDIYDSYYSLRKNKVENRYTIMVSLLEATIREFLNGCVEGLRKPNPGKDLAIPGRESEEIIRSAGRFLMYTPAWAGSEFDGLHGLFAACNAIASMKYEGTEGIGTILIARKNHPNIEILLTLTPPVKMKDNRAVRKLLEISSRDLSLLSDSGYIYGLGRITGIYESQNEDLYEIRFVSHHTWDLLHASNAMMRVTYGEPEMPKTKLNKEKFVANFQRTFKGLELLKIDKIWRLVTEASKQKHGTIIVVSKGAKDEAKRLGKQCFEIDAVQLTAEIVKGITAIDGAVLIDENSICYAMGVILDGLATEKGTPSRGARYNSAIRYIETSEYPCMAVVVSADGMIDLVPDLRPQIFRSWITDRLEQLRSLKKGDLDKKKFNEVMRWFQEHKFYLSKEICDEINESRKIIEDRMKENDPNSLIRLYENFKQDGEMNDSYFMEE